MNIQIINPVEQLGWDDLLLSSNQASFFHTAGWARVLSESYGYNPLYFSKINDGRISGLIPVMEIKSFLTGRRGVSLPFTDFCQPLSESTESFNSVMDAVIQYGRKARWKVFELRGGGDYLTGHPASVEHVTHTLALDRDEQKVFSAFKSNTRRNIRRAGSEGVEVQLLNSRGAMADFYRLNCITRKHHGLPPQPWIFFEKMLEHIVAAQKGFIALAIFKGVPIAGGVYFYFHGNGIYKYGASAREYQQLRANNLVMWEAIRWCCRNGATQFHFGRTELKNAGLIQFKRGWGAIENKLSYYKYDLRSGSFVTGESGPKSSYEVFKRIPQPVLRVVGNMLYRHVG